MTTPPQGRVLDPDHWPADDAQRIDAYRYDARGQLLRVWISGVSFVYGGLTLALLSGWLAHRVPTLARLGPWLGLAAFGFGVFAVLRGLFASLRHEHYVSLRTDGLVIREQGAPHLLRWDELEDVTAEPPHHVELRLRGGEVRRLDATVLGVQATVLARRIAFVRRRALWGFYEAR